jgi:GH15 family glucan-1,4-alpha-glucosidase
LTLPLRRRGLISDQNGAALVAADTTIDWWCPEHFAARPVLAGLLDAAGGRVSAGPTPGPPAGGDQRYDPGTNVLRTSITTAAGTLEVADFMPWAGPGHTPPGRIVRLVTVLAGRVEVAVTVEPGRDGWSEGVAGPGFTVHTGLPMAALAGSPAWRGSAARSAGERLVITLDPAGGSRPRPEPLTVDEALRLLAQTAGAWRSQVAESTVEGPYRDAAERSLLVVRALTSAAAGGLVAAPTASLPEQPGGERNFDARLCFTADAATAADVLGRAGLAGAASDHREWLAGLLRDGDLPLAAAHTADGGPAPEEEELPWAGFLRSQPVRLGWTEPDVADFRGQAALLRHGDPDLAWAEAVALADWLAEHWPNAPLVADRLAVAAALERMAAAARRKHPLDLDAAGWQQDARAIYAWVGDDGLAAAGGLRRDVSPADHPDADLLAVAWQGPWPPDHAVVMRTVEQVLARLGHGPALIERYPPEVDDGLPPGRPPGLAASFAAVKALAALGRWEEAHARMEVLCGLTGPLGLAGESADARTGRVLGNYPAAAAHLALVDAALALNAGPL